MESPLLCWLNGYLRGFFEGVGLHSSLCSLAPRYASLLARGIKPGVLLSTATLFYRFNLAFRLGITSFRSRVWTNPLFLERNKTEIWNWNSDSVSTFNKIWRSQSVILRNKIMKKPQNFVKNPKISEISPIRAAKVGSILKSSIHRLATTWEIWKWYDYDFLV